MQESSTTPAQRAPVIHLLLESTGVNPFGFVENRDFPIDVFGSCHVNLIEQKKVFNEFGHHLSVHRVFRIVRVDH